MKTINRGALVVRPKEPYHAWARSLEENSPIDGMTDDLCSVYLVTANEDAEPDKVVRRHYKDIFEEQLFSWHTRTEDWPAKRTLAVFREWFDVQFVDLLFDLGKGMIRHEE